MIDENGCSKIKQHLTDLRKSTHDSNHDGAAKKLITLLEDEKTLAKFKDKAKHQVFYTAYVIKLLKKYAPDEYDVEIMLNAYGFLQEYDKISEITKRRTKYAQDALYCNKNISDGWAKDNLHGNLAGHEDKIIKEITKRIIEAAVKNEKHIGFLDLAEEVITELNTFYPDGFPDKLPLPKAKFVKNANDTNEKRSKPGTVCSISEPESKITDNETLGRRLIHLCSSDSFRSEISDLKDALDLPTELDHADMKALLICAVVDCFGEKSFETDAVLMEFGLSSEKGLEDNLFEHDSDTEESRLYARRKEFLKISNYIYKTRNSRKKYKFNTYEEMVKLGKDAIDTTIETLGNRNGGYIEAVAKKIYTKRNDKNFIESRKEYLEGSGKARKVKPPPMTNFRDKSSSQPQGEEPNGSVEPDGTDTGKTEPPFTNIWWGNFSNNKILKSLQQNQIFINLFNITETNQHVTIGGNFAKREINYKKIISGAVIVIAITALAYGGYKAVYKSSHRQPIKEILISSTEIILEPDEIFDLDEYISVLPKSITNPILSFTSSDPDLVTVSKDGLLNAKNVQQDDELHTAEITVQAENGTTAKKIVHVQDSDKETSIDTDYEINQEVRIAGDTDKTWKKEVNAKVGDKVEFQLEYLNTDPNGLSQRDVVVGNTLPASLKYVAGSTKIWNESYNGASIDQDTIVTTGVNIGHYAAGANAFVRFTAEVVAENLAKGSNVLVTWGRTTVGNYVLQDSAKVRVRNDVNEDTEIFYTIENDVRIVNSIDKTWKKEVNAKIGDKVEFQIEYKNTSGESQKNVMLRDILPANLKYIPDSTRLANGNHPNGATIDQDDLVTTKGINIGSYTPGANALVRFYAEVVDENLADGEFVLHNWAHGTVNAKVLQDSARVRVEK